MDAYILDSSYPNEMKIQGNWCIGKRIQLFYWRFKISNQNLEVVGK